MADPDPEQLEAPFADIPMESLVHQHQVEYYRALQESTNRSDSAPFIEFTLGMILEAIATSAPQVTPQVRRLLAVIEDDMLREQLQSALGLQDRKSFHAIYLKPALAEGWVGRVGVRLGKGRGQACKVAKFTRFQDANRAGPNWRVPTSVSILIPGQTELSNLYSKR